MYEDALFDVSELEMAARGLYHPPSPFSLAADLHEFSKTAVSRKFGADGYRFTIETDGRKPLHTVPGDRAMCLIAAYAHPAPEAPETWGKIIMRIFPIGIDVKIYYDQDGLGADGLRDYISEMVKYLAENDFEPDTAITVQTGGDEGNLIQENVLAILARLLNKILTRRK